MLTFNLKKQWFDKIKSGEKTHEYREVKPYWTKRLNPRRGLLYLKSINFAFDVDMFGSRNKVNKYCMERQNHRPSN